MLYSYKVLRHLLFTFLLVFCLASCGGGGGGGGSSEPQTAADGRDEALLETAANTTVYSLSLSEGLIELAQFGVRQILLHQLSFFETPALDEAECESGTLVASFVDTDNSLQISAGDQITLVADSCESRSLYGEVSGGVSVDIESYRLNAAGEVELAAEITFDDGFYILSEEATEISFEGTLAVTYQLTDSELLQVTNTLGGDLVVFSEGEMERLRIFSVEKRAPLPGYSNFSVDLSVNLDVASDLLGADVRCGGESLVYLGPGATVLNSSDFACSGDFGELEVREGNRIFIALPSEAALIHTYDLSGDEAFDGAISSGALFDSKRFAFSIESRAIFATINALRVDNANNRVLLAMDEDSATFPSAIVSYGPNNGFEPLIELDFNPGKMALSADGSLLYVAQPGQGIKKFDVVSSNLLDSIDLSDEVLDLVVSPVDPNQLAVFSANPESLSHNELIIYSSVVEQARERTNFDISSSQGAAQDQIRYLSGGGRLFVRGRIFDFSGTELTESQYRLRTSNVGTVENGVIYSGGGIYDEDDFYKRGQFSKGGSYAVADLDFGLAFLVETQINICEIESLMCFDSIPRTDSYGNNVAVSGPVVLSQGELLVVSEGVLNIYSVSDFERLNPESCVAQSLDVSGQENFLLDCSVMDVVYDELSGFVYALVSGGSTNEVWRSQVLKIDPSTLVIESFPIPLAYPRAIAISSNGSVLYVHQSNTDVILRFKTEDGAQLEPLVVREMGSEYIEGVSDILGVLASAVDPDLILLQRDYAGSPGQLIGFEGQEAIGLGGYFSIGYDSGWADHSGAFYASGSSTVSSLQVSGGALTEVETFSYETSCGILQALDSGFLLNSCGEIVDMADGSIGSPLDFSNYSSATVNGQLLVPGGERLVYAPFYTDDRYSEELNLVRFDLDSKAEVDSASIGLGVGLFDPELKAVTSGGEVIFLGEEGELVVVTGISFD